MRKSDKEKRKITGLREDHNIWNRREKVIGICCSDMHLSLKPPIWRSAEEDWLEAQKRPLLEIEELSTEYDCPVFCAGDIFNWWDSQPELINFALNYLPSRIYVIPGQHDLPLHNIKDIYKSAFWTLVMAGKVQYDNAFNQPRAIDGQTLLYDFEFGKEIKPLKFNSELLDVCMAHQYNWIRGYEYPGAPRAGKLGKNRNELKEYDVVIFGDNHKGFLTKIGKTTVFNCGTIIRRHIDERKYRPQVGLLLNTGEIKIHYLDISKDKYLHVKKDELKESDLDTREFFDELEKLGDVSLDFEEVVKRFFEGNKVNSKVKKIILKAMG